jgi:hypothetical protein
MYMPQLKPWAMFALFVLVFPTGNAIAERGFSAMGAVHSKQRSDMNHAQVLANLIIVEISLKASSSIGICGDIGI